MTVMTLKAHILKELADRAEFKVNVVEAFEHGGGLMKYDQLCYSKPHN